MAGGGKRVVNLGVKEEGVKANFGNGMRIFLKVSMRVIFSDPKF